MSLKANSLSVPIILFSNLSNYHVHNEFTGGNGNRRQVRILGTDITIQEIISLVLHEEKLNQVPLKIMPDRQQIR